MNFDEKSFISDLSGMIEIKSVKGDCGAVNEKYPLGEGIGKALEYIEDLGKKYGFTTKNLDNKCVYIEAGEGEKLLGILVHADTVGVDDKWTYDPFKLTLENDILYGRGVADNKGSAILMLHVMKYLKENNLIKGKRVRLIVGGDEEAGEWECIKRYKETEEAPTVAFSPDGDYPVVFAEKGILKIKLSKKNDDKEFSFSGGKTANIVPDFAECSYHGRKFSFIGKSAHSMEPHKGVNASLKLAEKLYSEGVSNDFVTLLMRANVKDFDIELCDRASGELTVNPSIARVYGNEKSLVCDIRYPVTHNADEITERIRKSVADLGYSLEVLSHQLPLYVDKESHLVKTLLNVYNEFTGKNDKPVSMGGGTYARAFENAVAFGVWFPEKESAIHKENEWWAICDIKKNFEIMTEAVKRL